MQPPLTCGVNPSRVGRASGPRYWFDWFWKVFQTGLQDWIFWAPRLFFGFQGCVLWIVWSPRIDFGGVLRIQNGSKSIQNRDPKKQTVFMIFCIDFSWFYNWPTFEIYAHTQCFGRFFDFLFIRIWVRFRLQKAVRKHL